MSRIMTRAVSLLNNLFTWRTPEVPRPPTNTPTPSGDLRTWARATVEKIRSAAVTGVVRFLPYLDRLTEETDEIRSHYRLMLREPVLKAALLSKVLSVAHQEVQVTADDPDDPGQVKLAELTLKALHRCKGGTRKIAWSVLSGGLVDGWSLTEVILRPFPERSGIFKGKVLWDTVKSKDTTNLQPIVDAWHNVVGIKANLYNGGHVFQGAELESFMLFSHLAFFENPRGMSDFRAPYRAFWIKDTTWQLRAIHLDKYTTPFLHGQYSSLEQRQALEEALEEARAHTWLTTPTGALVDAIDIAGRGTADYESAIKDCDREMLIGTVGAYLHMLEGSTPDGRGDTEVQQEESELLEWSLASILGDLVSEKMVAPWVRYNYGDIPPPLITWGAVSEKAMEARARIDQMLQQLGLDLSKKEAYAYYRRQRPADAQDILRPGGAGGDQGGGGDGGGGQPPGKPGDTGEAQTTDLGWPGQSSFGEPEDWLELAEPSVFAEADWRREPGPRSQRRWINVKTGKVVYSDTNPGARRQQQPNKPAQATKPKLTVEAAHAHIQELLGNPPQDLGEAVKDLAGKLGSGLTVAELNQLKQRLGLKASGNKAALAQKLAERALTLGKPSHAEHALAGLKKALPHLSDEELAQLAHDRPALLKALQETPDEPGQQQPEQPAGEPGRSPGTGEPPPAAGAAVEAAAPGSGSATPDQGGNTGDQSAGAATPGRVPADIGAVNSRLDRFQRLFQAKGQHQLADWMGQLRSHINATGGQTALDSLGEELGAGTGQQVQYGGVDTEESPHWASMGDFIDSYLRRAGIIALTGQGTDLSLPVVNSQTNKDPWGGGVPRPEDIALAETPYEDKLQEAKDLPGLETSEDIEQIMGAPVTHITPEVIAKMNERYGEGGWLIKTYSPDNAFAGFGIFFPQRAAQITQEARNTIWTAGEKLSQYGFRLGRNPDTGQVFGLVHESGDTYQFGTPEYESTIGGDARHWAEQARAAADNEKGAMLPNGGKQFMAQPAFPVLGVTEEERAQGKTIVSGEGRVHVLTRPDGTVEVIPHSTWLKGANLPVVFEDEDSRAMAQAAQEAISQLPAHARTGQLYAPDIVKTANGYRVVELNASVEHGGSGYLSDNPFIIDAYVSHVAGREPAHVRFIRQLLTSRRKETAAS